MGRALLKFVTRFGDFPIPTRPWPSVFGGICLVHVLSGCILGSEKPELAIDIPSAYRHAGAKPYAALPNYEWWRSFRSRELTVLIDEAQHANLDIAAAVGRILQADAQARLAGAPLLPTVDLEGDASRSRPSRTTSGAASDGLTSVSSRSE